MRVLRLDLTAFGPFTGLALDLSDDQGILQLIYGSNGAGKSSALRGLVSMLFEFETRTTDDYIHDMSKLRVGGLIDPGDGMTQEVVRHKGRKDTLRGPDGKPVTVDPFVGSLGGLSRVLFMTMFALDHMRLRSGGEQLVRGGEDLAESLFGAGLGRGVHQVLSSLSGMADEIFAPRATTRPLNVAISAHRDAKRSARTAFLRPDDWVKAQSELRDLEEADKQLAAEVKELEPRKARLERLQQLLPLLGRHDEYRDQRSALGSVVLLSEGSVGDRKKALEVLRTAGLRLAKLAEGIAGLEAELKELEFPQALLARAQLIKDLGKQLGAQQKAATDRVNLIGQIAVCRRNTEALLIGLGREPSLEAAATLNVETLRQRRIRQFASDKKAHDVEMSGAVAKHEEAARKLERAKERVDGLAAPRDLGALDAALKSARASGDLEAQSSKAAERAKHARRIAEDRLAALGLWKGPIEEAVRLTLPPAETIDRFEQGWKSLEKERAFLDNVRGELEKRADRTESEIEEMRRKGEIPTEAELDATRERRNAGWNLVRRAWLNGDDVFAEAEVAMGEASLATDETSLANAYETSVTAADDIADRLRAEADRAARYGQLLADTNAAEKKSAELDAQKEALEVHARKVEKEWHSLWEDPCIEPLPPGEMRSWLSRHAKLVDAIETMHNSERDLDAISERVDTHREQIYRCLSEIRDGQEVDDGMKFAEVFQRAEGVMTEAGKTEDERRHLSSQVEELTDELERAQQVEKRARDAIESWRSEWRDAIVGLPLRPDASPVEAEAFLDEVVQLRKHLDEERGFQVRVDGIDELTRRFEEKVAKLVSECAADLEGKPAEDATEELLEQLGAGENAQAARSKVSAQLEKHQDERDSLEVEQAAAQAKLDELLERAGSLDVAALEEAEERSAKARELDGKIEEQRTQIRAAGGGADIDALRAEVASINPDTVPTKIDEFDSQIQDLRRRQHENATAVGSKREAVAAMDTGPAAAEAATQAQQALAEIRELALRYARCRIAAHLLEQEVHRYREENQGPLLERAGELFRRLTVGSFSGLTVEFDVDGGPVLECVRGDDKHVRPSVLSDGESDQLYLALRLASIERHLNSNEAVPFVADDIFVNFDDDRARAGLEVLGEVAQRTQVLFFTHHARLVELAKEALPAGRARIFTL